MSGSESLSSAVAGANEAIVAADATPDAKLAAILRRMFVREAPDDDDDEWLDGGLRRHLTLKRAHNENAMSKEEPQLVDTLHLASTADGRGGLFWVLARDVDAGTILYDEMPLAYVAYFDDTIDRQLEHRSSRVLLPPKPKLPATMDRLYGGDARIALD